MTKRPFYQPGRRSLAALAVGLAFAAPVSAQTRIAITGKIFAPIPCVINGNQGSMIDVPFGEVLTTRVDGQYLTKDIPYGMDCSNASTNSLRMQITGSLAGFGDGLLGIASNPHLAIALKDGSTPVALEKWFDFDSTKPPRLKAVLVKDPAGDIEPGQFSVGATLIVEYR
ncbi:fimbrial protein [Achromobacter marplatensis]|uniref:fimbrial protein n=1 Tax=Achromobacter marplatensis TaxID=470868 RepID=UPI0039F6B0D1